jgi:hypothetical protein
VMRNLLLLQDTLCKIGSNGPSTSGDDLVCLCRDVGSNNLFALTAAGLLYTLDTLDGFSLTHESWDLNCCNGSPSSSNASSEWFNVAVVSETGSIVCISHAGLIVSIKEDLSSGRWSPVMEQEGDVDGGIATAAWSPDGSRLALLTNNNTILLMTGYWDVLEEVPLPPRVPGSACAMSWRGDGEYLSIISVDADDNLARVRVFTKDLEMHSTGRNVAEGPASVLKVRNSRRLILSISKYVK